MEGIGTVETEREECTATVTVSGDTDTASVVSAVVYAGYEVSV